MTRSSEIKVVDPIKTDLDVIDTLVQQHQQVKVLLDQVLSESGANRQAAFDEVRELLARHETAEEMVLRPLTRSIAEGEQVASARMDEENRAKEALALLEALDVDSAEFETGFVEFRVAVMRHAEAEETQEFPALRAGTDRDKLSSARGRLLAAEKMAPTHPHPSAKTTTMNYVAGPFAAMLDRARDAFSKRS